MTPGVKDRQQTLLDPSLIESVKSRRFLGHQSLRNQYGLADRENVRSGEDASILVKQLSSPIGISEKPFGNGLQCVPISYSIGPWWDLNGHLLMTCLDGPSMILNRPGPTLREFLEAFGKNLCGFFFLRLKEQGFRPFGSDERFVSSGNGWGRTRSPGWKWLGNVDQEVVNGFRSRLPRKGH